MESLSKIIYENITEDIGYGNYLGLKVIIMTKNGYINATKLCKLCNKHLEDWNRLLSTKDYLEYKNKDFMFMGIPMNITISQGKNQNDIAGTYYHPDIIVQISNWISFEIADKISKIVNNFVIKEFKSQIQAKDDKISILIANFEKAEKRREEDRILYEKSREEDKNRYEKLLNTSLETNTLIKKLCNNYVIELKKQDLNDIFLILKHKTNPRLFYVIRRQIISLQSAIRNIEDKYETILYENTDPNAINFFNQLKQDNWFKNNFTTSQNILTCNNDITDEIFLSNIRRILETRSKHN